MSILDRVVSSFESLGGVAKLKDIYQVYKDISSKEEISKTFDRSIQARIKENEILNNYFNFFN